MSEILRELPADAVVHRLAAPEFSLPYPEIWNEHLIPDNASTSGMRSRWNTGTFGGRPVTLWVLENVFVVGDGLVFDRDLNLYRIPHQVRPPAAIEAALDRLRAARSGLSLEPGLHVLCKDRGAGVYGHWLIDLLPRAYFARKLLQQPFLTIVPQAHGALSTSIADSLALLGFSSSDLVTVDAAPRWFERVVVVDGLSCHGPYMSPLVFEALDALREKVAPQGATRLYVDRPATDHRRFKDAQLIRTLAGEAGFAAIDPGTLPISEQIGRFAAARTIFGVMGSAMANIAFAAPGATVFICAPASMADTFFWFIAGHRKLRYIEIRCSQAPKSGTHEWDAEITLSDADRARIFSTARPGMDAGVSMTQMRTAAEAPGAAGTAGKAFDSGAGHRDGPGAPAITEQYLLDRVWKFYRKNGAVASNRLRFLPNGKISGYTHPNERSWLLDQGCLAFANGEARITTRFDSVTIQDGVTTLCGPYLADPSIILCLSDQTEAFPRNPGTKAALARQIAARGWQIGDHTYGVPSFFDVEDGKLTIGKYTSIAAGVKIALADHRMDTVSTYPFAVLRAYWPSVPLNASDHTSKGPVVIGNDVWIGADAIILSGVSVGSGAVIGAKAVVSQDVPPYAVVVGSPARVVRYRFPDNVIARLLGVAWWDWPDEVVDAHLPLMMSSDIEAFLAAAEAFCATR